MTILSARNANNGLKASSRILPAPEAMTWQSAAKDVISLTLDTREVQDLLLIGSGAYAPLIGFLVEEDFRSVRRKKQLANGFPWSNAIILRILESDYTTLQVGHFVALRDTQGGLLGRLQVQSLFQIDEYENDKSWAVGGAVDALPDIFEKR